MSTTSELISSLERRQFRPTDFTSEAESSSEHAHRPQPEATRDPMGRAPPCAEWTEPGEPRVRWIVQSQSVLSPRARGGWVRHSGDRDMPGSIPGRQGSCEPVPLGALGQGSKMSPLDDYRKHAENARALKRSLVQAERLHKDAIKRGNEPAVDYMRRMHYLTVGLFAENLLRKTISNPDGFSDVERALVSKTASQIDRWKLSVDLAFRRHFTVPFHVALDDKSIGKEREKQYALIDGLLAKRLAGIISDRNKIAHAQWVWKPNKKGTKFSAADPPVNYRQIKIRSDLVWEISEVITALVISEPTFDAVFARHFGKISGLETDLANDGYPALVLQLKSRVKP